MEITVEYEELELYVQENYLSALKDGEAQGISNVMHWLESGRDILSFEDLKSYLLEKGEIESDASNEILKKLNWFRIQDSINKKIDDVT